MPHGDSLARRVGHVEPVLAAGVWLATLEARHRADARTHDARAYYRRRAHQLAAGVQHADLENGMGKACVLYTDVARISLILFFFFFWIFVINISGFLLVVARKFLINVKLKYLYTFYVKYNS